MNHKVSELHGQAFYRRNGDGARGWCFRSDHDLTAGLTFGPFSTPDWALRLGPPLAACYGVELATAIAESRTEAE